MPSQYAGPESGFPKRGPVPQFGLGWWLKPQETSQEVLGTSWEVPGTSREVSGTCQEVPGTSQAFVGQKVNYFVEAA